MALTPLDVLDSAVKIGMGAAIAGIVALVVPFVTFAKETIADRRARRLKMIEDTVLLLDEYFSLEMLMTATTSEYRHRELANIMSEICAERYLTGIRKADEAAAKFNRASSYLTLLGHSELRVKAVGIHLLLDEAQRKMNLSKSVDEVDFIFERVKGDASGRINDLYTELGLIYKHEPELKNCPFPNFPVV
jgi:hypothetical protein